MKTAPTISAWTCSPARHSAMPTTAGTFWAPRRTFRASRYKAARYCSSDIVISFAGNIGAEEAMALAENFFGGLPAASNEARPKQVVWNKGGIVKKKSIEQVHFALGFPSVERDSDDVPAVQLMNAILGGGLSSRLFKRVREELGLAYDVYSYTSHYEETGMLTVYAGVEPGEAEDAAAAVREVIETFKRGGVSEAEFARGREQLKASSIFSQESTSSQMLLYGRNLLYFDEVYDFEKRMAEISALTREDVARVIESSLDLGRMATAAVGDLTSFKL